MPEETRVDPAAVEAAAAGYAPVQQQVTAMQAQTRTVQHFNAGTFEAAAALNQTVRAMADRLEGILVSVGAMGADLARGVVRSAQILSDADDKNDRLASGPYSDVERQHGPGLPG